MFKVKVMQYLLSQNVHDNGQDVYQLPRWETTSWNQEIGVQFSMMMLIALLYMSSIHSFISIMTWWCFECMNFSFKHDTKLLPLNKLLKDAWSQYTPFLHASPSLDFICHIFMGLNPCFVHYFISSRRNTKCTLT